jgi:hypothetical protein
MNTLLSEHPDVIWGAKIQWTPGSIAFPSAFVDAGVVARKLTINNLGRAALEVILSLGPELVGYGALFDVVDHQNNSVLDTPISIDNTNGDTLVLNVTFDYSSGIGLHKMNLQLQTNDPTNQNVQIPLSATVRDDRR